MWNAARIWAQAPPQMTVCAVKTASPEDLFSIDARSGQHWGQVLRYLLMAAISGIDGVREQVPLAECTGLGGRRAA